MKSSIVKILLITCLFFHVCGSASSRFEHLTTEDGLSQSTVRCILQDSKGFIWFGTYDGLNRYDGYTITTYLHDPEDDTTVASNHISSLFEDSQGNIWVGTFNQGISQFNPKTGLFKSFNDNPTLKTYTHNVDIQTITEDESGNIWIGTRGNGIAVYTPSTNEVNIFEHDPTDNTTLSSNIVTKVLIDEKQRIWVATHDGFNSYDQLNKSFIRFYYEPNNPQTLSDNILSGLAEGKDGIIWIGTSRGGLNKFNPISETFKSYKNNSQDYTSISSNKINSIYEDSRGAVSYTHLTLPTTPYV